ncbi:MAG: Uma2 family endonuclease [Saprospiraceae bacterium]|nr:Uma2 family endonuclease [Saprospiraceae bacterium]
MVKAIGKFKKPQKASIPDYLVYEMMDGFPIYYKDYKKVLNNEATLEDITGSSRVQSFIISLIEDFLKAHFKKKYWILSNELGMHLKHKNNLSADIAMFDKTTFPSAFFMHDTYSDKAPNVIIEVDSNANLEDLPFDYFSNKTDKLMLWGVQEVIWVFTKSRKIMVALPNKAWLTVNWDDDIEILNMPFNLIRYAESEGINLELVRDISNG